MAVPSWKRESYPQQRVITGCGRTKAALQDTHSSRTFRVRLGSYQDSCLDLTSSFAPQGRECLKGPRSPLRPTASFKKRHFDVPLITADTGLGSPRVVSTAQDAPSRKRQQMIEWHGTRGVASPSAELGTSTIREHCTFYRHTVPNLHPVLDAGTQELHSTPCGLSAARR